jgi:hypothetical protein
VRNSGLRCRCVTPSADNAALLSCCISHTIPCLTPGCCLLLT